MPESGTPSERAADSVPFAARALGTGLGIGYLPVAPGTAGSALALAIWFIPGAGHPALLGGLIAAGTLAGVWAAGLIASADGDRLTPVARKTKEWFGDRSRKGHSPADPSIVVIDEMVGMWTALLFLPAGDVPGAIVAFTLFRVFDIVKPPPVRTLERIGGGWGIILDDIAAGAYACILTHATLALL